MTARPTIAHFHTTRPVVSDTWYVIGREGEVISKHESKESAQLAVEQYWELNKCLTASPTTKS